MSSTNSEETNEKRKATDVNDNNKKLKATKMPLYDIMETDMDGNPVKMSDFQNSVIMCCNVASYWGYTNQYTELSELSTEYKDQGLKILLFPCNQFAAEEPGSHEEILQFVNENFDNASKNFTWFAKRDVNGVNTRDLYQYLKTELPEENGATDISWNFAKFLINHEGKPWKRYSPRATPFSMRRDIETLLSARNATTTTTNDDTTTTTTADK